MDKSSRIIGIFGADGFLGRALTKRLIADGKGVIAFGRRFGDDFDRAVGPAIDKRLIDFGQSPSLGMAMLGLTDVVQLINTSSPAMGNATVLEDIKVNVASHVAFIQVCVLSGIKSFTFISSGGAVYGEPVHMPIREDHPLRPINSYGMTKMMVENYLRLLSAESDMSAVSLRISNPFGPGQTVNKGQGLIASILRSATTGTPVTVFGDGSAQRDYLYVDDAVDAIVRRLNTSLLREEINIASGVGRSVIDVIQAVERALGRSLEVQYRPGRPTDPALNVLDPSKAARLLGWSATTNFFEAVEHTVSQWNKV